MPDHIAIVTERFYPAHDVDTALAKQLADHLIDGGHDVTIVAAGPGLGSYRGAVVHRVAPLSPGAQLRAALVTDSPDLVVVTTPAGLGERALQHTAQTGVPSLCVEQSDRAAYATERWRRKVEARADRLVVTSAWMRERLHAQDVEASLWLPGVDTAAFTPALRDPYLHDRWARADRAGGPLVVVGYAGSLRKRHGVRRLAELASLPGVRVVAIGEGAQRQWLHKRLPDVKLTGLLEPGDLAVALASLDVVVHPGTRQTSAPVLREAGASAVPVVAPRAGGARDVVRHLETGLLYDPADPRGLVDAIAALAADRSRGLLGAEGRRVMGARPWAVALDDLLSCAGETRRTPPLRAA